MWYWGCFLCVLCVVFSMVVWIELLYIGELDCLVCCVMLLVRVSVV